MSSIQCRAAPAPRRESSDARHVIHHFGCGTEIGVRVARAAGALGKEPEVLIGAYPCTQRVDVSTGRKPVSVRLDYGEDVLIAFRSMLA